ncbi:rhomboid family intramembrane serine protease, partial [uncultured Sphingobium sp.]|uniref:rhomboid family intramembrane serine protease n=1 Tax=uncultured Sphingobium sp. TaxID=316087 RepID=UPI00260551AF
MRLPSGRATNGLAAISVAVFLALIAANRVDDAAILGGFIPARFGDPGLLAGMAAVPAWLTPLSCTLVHAGWLHIAFNMLMLVFCGRQVEHVLGWSGTLMLYGVGAYAACLAQYLVDPASTNPMVGASGAISAIIATYSLLYSQQQVRNIWTNVGCFNLNLWMHTLVELWVWDQSHVDLCNRSDSPWDDAERRPSHADRRKALRRQIMRNELLNVTAVWRLPRKILQLVESL